MRRAAAAIIAMTAACSSLPDAGDGVVALEIQQPASLTLMVPESITLQARALDGNGDPVAAEVIWRTPDTTFIALDSVLGTVVARSAGTARVQARVGTLTSDIMVLTIKPDTTTLPSGLRQRR